MLEFSLSVSAKALVLTPLLFGSSTLGLAGPVEALAWGRQLQEVGDVGDKVSAAVREFDKRKLDRLVPDSDLNRLLTFGEKDRTCLVFAVLEGTPQAVDYFIGRGAEINGISGSKTALQYAIKYDKMAMVEHLLKIGADASSRPNGRSAVEYARGYKRAEALAILERHGVEGAGPLPLEDDGPYFVLSPDGSTSARWIEDQKLREQIFPKGSVIDLPRFAHLIGTGLDPAAKPKPKAAVWPQPSRVLAISDVEGSFDDVLRFLKVNGVVDEHGGWSFGDGHLVCVGDFVDRGSQVTETLWLFHRLEREAALAGGVVHSLIGNHEAMMLGGDLRYAAPKYARIAQEMGTTYDALVGDRSILGRWMRSCNSIVRIGDSVFVHAGLSPAFAAEKLDYEAVNSKIRSFLGKARRAIPNPEAQELIWGRTGPLWYRGYFSAHADDFGPVPTEAQLDQILNNAQAKRIVVGHTKVREVTPLFGGRVIAMDIPWTKPAAVKGLVFESGQIKTVGMDGEEQALQGLKAKSR